MIHCMSEMQTQLGALRFYLLHLAMEPVGPARRLWKGLACLAMPCPRATAELAVGAQAAPVSAPFCSVHSLSISSSSPRAAASSQVHSLHPTSAQVSSLPQRWSPRMLQGRPLVGKPGEPIPPAGFHGTGASSQGPLACPREIWGSGRPPSQHGVRAGSGAGEQ